MAAPTKVQAFLDSVILREGREYTDHPHDRGGPTKFGITLDTLSRWRDRQVSAEEVADLQEDEARQIYLHEYYVGPGFDQVARLSVPVAEELFDTGVNMGPEVASRFLQTVLTVFNRQGNLYPDLAIDGNIGPRTIDALHRFLDYRRQREGEGMLLRSLNCLQGARYIELALDRPENESFVYGWIQGRVVLQ